jgi:hypothetical protein
VSDLGHGADIFHVCGVDTGAENTANLHVRVGVGRGDKGTGGIVDEGGYFNGQALVVLS